MTIPASWPIDLPTLVVAARSYEENLETNLAQFAPSVGDIQTRMRSRIEMATISGSMVLSNAQVDSLLTFYHDTLIDGTQPFLLLDPRLQVIKKFTFTEPPVISGMSYGIYSVSLALRRLPYVAA